VDANGDVAPTLVTVPAFPAPHTGSPDVPIEFRKLPPAHVSDSTPPKVEAVGVGSRAAPSVPVLMLLALKLVKPAPLPVKEFDALLNVRAFP